MSQSNIEARMLRMLDGELSADEVAELDRELTASPEAREVWRSMAQMHSALETRFAANQTICGLSPIPIKRVLEQQQRKIIRLSVFGAAAALVIIATTLWLVMAPEPSPRLTTFHTAPGTEFTLSHLPGNGKQMGNILREGTRLTIGHGVAELQLPYDVRAVVEGPATVALQDDRTLLLDRGRALFEITTESGKGFTVITPHQRIVDLGTSFALNVEAGKKSVDLHVFTGRVRIDGIDGTRGQILKAPGSVQLHQARIGDSIEPIRFLSKLPEKLKTIFKEDFEGGLLADHSYSIRIDPSVVTDLTGQSADGIPENGTWKFHTASAIPDSVALRNPGFEEGGVLLERGRAIPGWHPGSDGAYGWGTDDERYGLQPAEGRFFGRVFPGRWLSQPIMTEIKAGTTYILTLDCALPAEAMAEVRLWGSDLGPEEPIARKTIRSNRTAWLKNRQLVFTASEEHATGQQLGVSLGCKTGKFAGFDRISLGTVPHPRISSNQVREISKSSALERPPRVIALLPEPESADFLPSEPLVIVFDKPIRSGMGRIVVHDDTTGKESGLIAGSASLKVDGETLKILPKLSLNDGEAAMGYLSGWQSNTWAGRFNPSGDGNWYRHEKLNDHARSGGTIDAMRGPLMATLHSGLTAGGIRRTISTIAPDTRYSVTAAIGVRDRDSNESSEFAGYSLRLRSGDTILAETVGTSPPGPPNSLTEVGVFWESHTLPEGITPGDPLTLEIVTGSVPNGYLDLDSIRVTSTVAGY